MATAAPFVKLLRELSNANDEYRSGALDLNWDGGKSSIYVVFGQPNHAVYDTEDGEHLEGQDALSALVHHLPRQFRVAPWRKEVVRIESLKCTMAELVVPFAQLAGAAPDLDPQTEDDALVIEASDDATPVHIRLDTFPLIPRGEAIWSEASANLLHLDVLIPKLPTCLLTLTGAKLRAVAVLIHGAIVDALWVDEEGAAAGEGAAIAIMGAREGSLSAYTLESTAVAEALTMLWRAPHAFTDLPIAWLDPQALLRTIEHEHRDRVLLVQTPVQRGVALFMGGRFVVGYTEQQRRPVADIAVLRGLLDSGKGTLTVLQRAGDRVTQPAYEAASPVPAGEYAGAPGVVPVAPSEGDDAGDLAAQTGAPAEGGASTGHPDVDGEQVRPDDGFSLGGEPGAALWRTDPPPPARPPTWTPDERYIASPTAADGNVAPVAAYAEVATGSEDGWGTAPRYEQEPAYEDPPVDFHAIKQDLIQIGVRWLGSDDVVPIAALIDRTPDQVDDFVATIEQIKSTPVAGHDPSVVRAMAREMHYYAAEALCAA